jgi:hypothetical protein
MASGPLDPRISRTVQFTCEHLLFLTVGHDTSIIPNNDEPVSLLPAPRAQVRNA